MIKHIHQFLLCIRMTALLGVAALCPMTLAQSDNEPLPVSSPVPEAAPTAPPTDNENVPAGRIRIRSQRQIFSPGEGVYRFYGEVSVAKAGLELHAAEMQYHAKDGVMVASGDVALTAHDGQTYRGQHLEYRPTAGTWAFRDWKTTLSPTTLGKPVVAPIFASGGSISQGDSAGLDMADTHLTSCDQETPHYEIVARDIDLYPGDKLIARDVDLYVLGKRIVRLPWIFFLLRSERPPIMPEFGQNDLEGYFMRLPYQYVLGDGQLGTLRLDLTQKRGVALGVDHFYNIGEGTGEAFGYTNPDSGDYTLRLTHDQPLLSNLNLNLALNRQRQTLVAGSKTSTASTLARLTRQTDHTASIAEYSQNRTGGSFNLRSSRLLLRHDIKAGDSTFSYNGEYRTTGYDGSGVADDEELWNNLLFTRRLGFADVNVRVDHRADPDGDGYTADTNLSRLQRLPEVTLQTDHTRFGWSIPNRLLVSWGSYRERADKDPLGRFLIDWQTTPKMSVGNHTNLQFTAGLRQTLYGDDAMSGQYQYQLGLTAQTRVGKVTNTFNYGRQKGSGYSPFYMDAVYPRHIMTNTLQYQTPSLKLGLTAGRDLEWNRWQDISLTADANAGKHFSTRQSLAFDPNLNRWRDLTSQFDWKQDPRLGVSLRTRYNMEDGKLRNVSGQINWVIDPKWQVQWRANYDGKRYYWNEWLVSRDLHCWEALLRFDGVNNQFGVTVRPKALERGIIPEIGVGYGNRWNMSVGMQF